MKPLGVCTELLRAPVAILAVAAVAAFLLGVHWSSSAVSFRIAFFSPSSVSSSQAAVTISPNANRSFDLSSLLAPSPASPPPSIRSSLPPPPLPLSPPPPLPPPPLPLSPPLPPPPPPPPPKWLESFGIVDENGVMADDFEVGDVDGSWAIPSSQEGTGEVLGDVEREKKEIKWVGTRIRRFGTCPGSMQEYVPCMDNEEEIGRLASTQRGERFERHCPADGKRLNCLVPAPKRYRRPIPWPMSRDEVYSSNVPRTGLVGDKEGHTWIARVKNKFRFPGGETEFTHSTDQYLDQISKMVPDIAFGYHTRVALDVGCGVASFGAFLLNRNVLTMSIAPKDEYGNQIQLALERGVPAMIASFATRRLLYSSQAFDLIHCSKCQINWTNDNGILLLEVDRLLRGGGYFVWAAEPVYKHEPRQQEIWKAMEDLADRIGWKLIKKEGNIAIWQKPPNKSSYVTRQSDILPSFCDEEDDPNDVWYVRLKPCISRLPENGSGSSIPAWPLRLHIPPQRLAYLANNELFKAESEYWNQIIESYVRSFRWKKMALRNIMDMRAGYGGFASALIKWQLDSWVMNVVPVSGPNTLPLIYDRGLIGVNHDWCEPFDTYPRTYDLLHAFGLFSIEYKRCNITSILLEMDRILRPGGYAYIRDSTLIINELQKITKAMRWRPKIYNTQEGRYASRKILICQKR